MPETRDALGYKFIAAGAIVATVFFLVVLFSVAGPLDIGGFGVPGGPATVITGQGSDSVPSPSNYSIGYIGCSNTRDSVQGYYMVQGNRKSFWPPYNTGGDSLDVWANPSASAWTLFDQQVQKYGQPRIVWFQECERASARVNNATVAQIISILRQHTTPSTIIYISPLNFYNPESLCALTGPQGVNDTLGYANYVAGTGLALRGPDLGPLNVSTTLPDMCHPNQAGMALIGRQLVGFFDSKA